MGHNLKEEDLDPSQCFPDSENDPQSVCLDDVVREAEDIVMALAPYNEDILLPFHKKEREFHFLGHTLRIQQEWGRLGVAAVVWDAAIMLCEYLVEHQEILSGKRVLELGAGTGLVGMVAALSGGDVTVTERSEVLPHLQGVITDNFYPGNYLIAVQELDWTRDYAYAFRDFDVILGADIVYVEETFPDLLRTLVHFSTVKTKILLSCKIRYDRDTNFLLLLEQFFTFSEVHFDSERNIRIYFAQLKNKFAHDGFV